MFIQTEKAMQKAEKDERTRIEQEQNELILRLCSDKFKEKIREVMQRVYDHCGFDNTKIECSLNGIIGHMKKRRCLFAIKDNNDSIIGYQFDIAVQEEKLRMIVIDGKKYSVTKRNSVAIRINPDDVQLVLRSYDNYDPYLFGKINDTEHQINVDDIRGKFRVLNYH